MYNCLRYCQRLFNPCTLEAVDQVILHNRRIYSNGGIIPRYFNSVSSAFKEGRIVPREKVSNFDELVSYISNLRRIQVEQISELFTSIKDDELTENQVLLILESCSTSIPGENIETRHVLCRSVLERFESAGKFSEKVYKSYITISTKNKQCLDVDSLISSLESNLTHNLLKLILRNTCECGDHVKALKVLSEMKRRKYTLDEEVFNYIILAHTIEGGLSSGLKVAKTMNMGKFKETSDSRFFLIKGLAQRKNLKEFANALEEYKISYSEDMILSLLDVLGSFGNQAWVKLLTNLVDKTLLSRYFMIELQKLCTQLVYSGKYDAALEIYKVFVNTKPGSTYGGDILREMVLCSAPVEKIVELANDLKESNLNEYGLERVTETALRNKMFPTAMSLLCHFGTLKPHYFWPLLMEAHSRDGEIGLLKVVQTATDKNVKFDNESFATFIFPRCNLTNPKRVITMFQEIGYTVRTLLTPMIIALLKRKEINEVIELLDKYEDVKVNSEDIVRTLSVTWLTTGRTTACLEVLEKVLECKSVGDFLVNVLEKMRSTSKLRHFIELLRECKKRNLTINSSSADEMLAIINNYLYSNDKMEEIQEAVNDLLDFTRSSSVRPFLHQNQMSVEQLELHLLELKTKRMETRGVLRKLIQKYSGQGNSDRVKELREELAARGYNSSPGMKSAVLHSHVQEGNLEEALDIYEELMLSSPTFKTDHFKIVDLANLLVKRDRFDEAVRVLKRSAIQTGAEEPVKSWERNILNLLKSITDVDKQKEMFKVLVDCGYCIPSNILLGAIIQLHLEKDTLENTVGLYLESCKKYGKTPMQVVLLSELLECKKEQLLQDVLDASAVVHGKTGTLSALVTAMCEKGFVKQVVAVLQDSTLSPSKDLEKRCERWVYTSNMVALQTLLAASKQLSPKLLNIPKIQLSIMQLYSKRNDCDGALVFWKALVDEEDRVDTDVDNEFCELLSRCKFNSPENLNMKYKLK